MGAGLCRVCRRLKVRERKIAPLSMEDALPLTWSLPHSAGAPAPVERAGAVDVASWFLVSGNHMQLRCCGGARAQLLVAGFLLALVIP